MNAFKYTRNLTKLTQIFVETGWFAVVLKLMNSNEHSFTLWQSIIAIYQCFRFLLLVVQYPEVRLVPNKEIDAVIHILEQTPLFNRYFAHQPGLGTRGEADRQKWLQAFRATRELFEHHFGIGSMGKTQPAHCEIVGYRFNRVLVSVQPAACEVCLKVAV
jgi:hypothetical protein